MNSIPLPAFQDNDLWALHDGCRAPVMDPGDAQPVYDCLQRDGLQLEPILVKHHRPDHIGGACARSRIGREFSRPMRERAGGPVVRLAAGRTAPHRHSPACGTHEDASNNLKPLPPVESCNLKLVNYSRRCEGLRKVDLPACAGPFLWTRLPGFSQAACGFDGGERRGIHGHPTRKNEFR